MYIIYHQDVRIKQNDSIIFLKGYISQYNVSTYLLDTSFTGVSNKLKTGYNFY